MVSYTGNLSEVKFFDPIEVATNDKVKTDSLENFQAAFSQQRYKLNQSSGATEIQNHTTKKHMRHQIVI